MAVIAAAIQDAFEDDFLSLTKTCLSHAQAVQDKGLPLVVPNDVTHTTVVDKDHVRALVDSAIAYMLRVCVPNHHATSLRRRLVVLLDAQYPTALTVCQSRAAAVDCPLVTGANVVSVLASVVGALQHRNLAGLHAWFADMVRGKVEQAESGGGAPRPSPLLGCLRSELVWFLLGCQRGTTRANIWHPFSPEEVPAFAETLAAWLGGGATECSNATGECRGLAARELASATNPSEVMAALETYGTTVPLRSVPERVRDARAVSVVYGGGNTAHHAAICTWCFTRLNKLALQVASPRPEHCSFSTRRRRRAVVVVVALGTRGAVATTAESQSRQLQRDRTHHHYHHHPYACSTPSCAGVFDAVN